MIDSLFIFELRPDETAALRVLRICKKTEHLAYTVSTFSHLSVIYTLCQVVFKIHCIILVVNVQMFVFFNVLGVVILSNMRTKADKYSESAG